VNDAVSAIRDGGGSLAHDASCSSGVTTGGRIGAMPPVLGRFAISKRLWSWLDASASTCCIAHDDELASRRAGILNHHAMPASPAVARACIDCGVRSSSVVHHYILAAARPSVPHDGGAMLVEVACA